MGEGSATTKNYIRELNVILRTWENDPDEAKEQDSEEHQG